MERDDLGQHSDADNSVNMEQRELQVEHAERLLYPIFAGVCQPAGGYIVYAGVTEDVPGWVIGGTMISVGSLEGAAIHRYYSNKELKRLKENNVDLPDF